jgi:hypothetical protein
LPALAIESYGEIDSNVGSIAIKAGTSPSALLFAFLDCDCSEYDYSSGYEFTSLDRRQKAHRIRVDSNGNLREKQFQKLYEKGRQKLLEKLVVVYHVIEFV